MNDELVKARVAARQVAIEEVAPLLHHMAAEMTDDQRQEYWKEIRAIALQIVPLPPAPATLLRVTPMTDSEARRWQANTEMPFGRYQGDWINDIAATAEGRRYLRWYADLTFQDELRRYLANPDVARDFQ
jgi:uncharacterized protein (DUF3820 family)